MSRPRAGVTYHLNYAKMFGPLGKKFYPVVRNQIRNEFPKDRAQEAADLARELERRHKRREARGPEFMDALRKRYLELLVAKFEINKKKSNLISEMTDEEILALLASTGKEVEK